MRRPLRHKCYNKFTEDIWFDFFFKEKLRLTAPLALLLNRKRKFYRSKELISSFLPGSGTTTRSRFRPRSRFKKQLLDKQKLQLFYRVLKDSQLKNYIHLAAKLRGPLESNLLFLLESRLSSILVRAGFFRSTIESRQFIAHRGVTVDNKITNLPNQLAPAGSFIKLPAGAALPCFLPYPSPYIEVSWSSLSVIFYCRPKPFTIVFPFDYSISDVISFYL